MGAAQRGDTLADAAQAGFIAQRLEAAVIKADAIAGQDQAGPEGVSSRVQVSPSWLGGLNTW